MKAMIKAEKTDTTTSIEIAGMAKDVMYLMAALVNDIAETSHVPVDYVTEHLIIAIHAFKKAKAMAEAENEV